ncbi:AAA family ATPase [Ahniella affigens]|nr:AAA family ATPase [Ahniella affigens]
MNALNLRLKSQKDSKEWTPNDFDNALEAMSTAINRCLKPSGWGELGFSFEREEIVARHPVHGELPVGMLSDGIRSMLTLVADVAFRAVKLNPNFGPYAPTEVQGIVLIDEVDMHLHPAWQQTVLSSLQEAFPRIQFIVTTHSPQVLSTVPAASIRLLQGYIDETTGGPTSNVREFNIETQGVASSTVMAQVMSTDPIPDIEQARWLSRYQALIAQSAHESLEGAELRMKLISHFGEGHPVMLECGRLIRLEAYRARMRAKHDPVPENDQS